jgi:hypothetical protein
MQYNQTLRIPVVLFFVLRPPSSVLPPKSPAQAQVAQAGLELGTARPRPKATRI